MNDTADAGPCVACGGPLTDNKCYTTGCEFGRDNLREAEGVVDAPEPTGSDSKNVGTDPHHSWAPYGTQWEGER